MMRGVVIWSLRFRLLVVLLAAGALITGIAQLRAAPVDVLPEFSPPYIEIQTEALGLSANEVEEFITVPLEGDLLNGVAGITSIRRTLQAHIEAGALRVAAGRLFDVEPESPTDEGAPTLAERLRALGVVPVDAVDAALLPVAVPAAELLGGAYPSVLARLDARWRERVDEWWEEAHREALQQALAGQPTTGHVWAQASALAHYREAHERTASGR